MPKIPSRFAHPSWIQHGEIGRRLYVGYSDTFFKGLYSSFWPSHTWGEGSTISQPGAIANLDFSPDGSLLVAGCQNSTILMFDPLNRKMISGIRSSYGGRVNQVKFLDSMIFATAFGDNTLRLWDARTLRQVNTVLPCHSQILTNIEYSQNDDLIITSGLDGTVYTWKKKKLIQGEIICKKIFSLSGDIPRVRLNPDASKMIICMRKGYLIIVHNLDLPTLDLDFSAFDSGVHNFPDLRLVPSSTRGKFLSFFSHKRKKNRLELITDFPSPDSPKMIYSLDIHPQGWSAFTKSLDTQSGQEWFCVHDIQEHEMPGGDSSLYKRSEDKRSMFPEPGTSDEAGVSDLEAPETGQAEVAPVETHQGNGRQEEEADEEVEDQETGERNIMEANKRNVNSKVNESESILVRSIGHYRVEIWSNNSHIRSSIRASSNDLETSLRMPVGALPPRSSGVASAEEGGSVGGEEIQGRGEAATALVPPHAVARSRREGRQGAAVAPTGDNAHGGCAASRAQQAGPSRGQGNAGAVTAAASSSLNPIEDARNNVIRLNSANISSFSSSNTSPYWACRPKLKSRFYEYIPRLTHYIETQRNRPFNLEEICFSPDGRVMCIPYGNDVRLLAFSPECSEQSVSWSGREPFPLRELKTYNSHGKNVLCVKFSPCHCLVVSGCEVGRISWHEPIL